MSAINPERNLNQPQRLPALSWSDGGSFLPSGTYSLAGLIRDIGSDTSMSPSNRVGALTSLFERMGVEGRAFTPALLCLLGYHVARNLKESIHVSVGDEKRLQKISSARFFCDWAAEGYRLSRMGAFKPEQVVMMGRAMAIADVNDGRIANHLSTELRGKVHELTLKEVAVLAWAYAALDGKDRGFVREVTDAIYPRIMNLEPKEVVDLLWAFAKTSRGDREITKSLVACLKRHLTYSSHKELGMGEYLLSNTVWSLGKLGFHDEELMHMLGDALLQEERALDIRTAPHLLWTYTNVGISHDGLFRELAAVVDRDLEKLSPSNLTSVVWAFGTFNMKNERVFRRASELSHDDVKNVRVSSLGRLASGCAKQGYRDEKLFKVISSAILTRAEALLPQTVVNVAEAFALLGIEDEPLFRCLRQVVVSGEHAFPTKLLAPLAWSFGVNHAHLLRGMCDRRDLLSLGSDGSGWIKIYNALLVADLVDPHERFDRYDQIVSRYVLSAPSSFERDVERTIRDILRGKEYSLSHQEIISGIPTDIVLEISGKKIAIECDGDRYHRLWGPSGGLDVPTGKDFMQDKVFLKSGIAKVFHVRAADFYLNPNELPDLAEYLRQI